MLHDARLLLFALLCWALGCSGREAPMIEHVIIITGQSIPAGVNAGETGADIPAVRYWRTTIAGDDANAYADLYDGFGYHYGLGRILNASGHKVRLIVICKGSTFSKQWGDPAEAVHISAVAELEEALNAIPGDSAPNTSYAFHHIRDQGEAEKRYGYPVPNPAETAIISLWQTNTQAWHDTVKTTVAARMSALGLTATIPEKIVVLTNLHMDNETLPGVVRDLQFAYGADGIVVNRDTETGVAYESDGVHPTTAGFITIGPRLADAVEEQINMGTLSTALLNRQLDHMLGVAAYSDPATVDFGVFVGGVEVTGGSYARKTVTNDTTLFPNASGRVKTTGIDVVFATATADWTSTADIEIRIFDGDTDELMGSDTLTLADGAILNGQTLTIPAGSIDITASAGALSDTWAHKLLNQAFGGTNYTAETNTKFAYYAGDPQAAAAEITGTGYTRDTNASNGTTWSAASGGVIRNLIDFSVGTAGAADWTTATYWALFDNAGTGLMISAALPASRAVANGATETIQVNRIRVTLL